MTPRPYLALLQCVDDRLSGRVLHSTEFELLINDIRRLIHIPRLNCLDDGPDSLVGRIR